MVVKFNPGENYESWVTRMQADECARAQRQITKGIEPNVVLEEFSKRISQKLLHPILVAIRSSHNNYDTAQGREAYYAKMNGRGPVADHVLDDKDV